MMPLPRRSARLALAAALAAALLLAAPHARAADDGAPAAAPSSDTAAVPAGLPAGANTMCPVLPDEPVDPEIWVDYQGRRVYLCCQRCKKKFLESPDEYLAALEASPRAGGSAPAAPLSGAQRLVRFAGRFHPATIHFPIALIAVAALFEVLGAARRDRALSVAAVWLAALGAAGAVASAALGWSAAAFSSFPGELARVLETHRWLGLATATVAVLAALAGIQAQRRGAGWPLLFRLLLLAATVLVLVTGFFGGVLIYGFDHYRW
ncbi:MAG: hypothetical protein MUF27_15840 [Acidobacteria bacterium]|jgi:uncharacterized membrane protein/YHS domain-containing protein|nr:hypothetical protein [Acidobacteriota bacterium]